MRNIRCRGALRRGVGRADEYCFSVCVVGRMTVFVIRVASELNASGDDNSEQKWSSPNAVMLGSAIPNAVQGAYVPGVARRHLGV